VAKPRTIKSTGYATYIGETRNTYKNVIDNLTGRYNLEDLNKYFGIYRSSRNSLKLTAEVTDGLLLTWY
jgi:hypothetical protein